MLPRPSDYAKTMLILNRYCNMKFVKIIYADDFFFINYELTRSLPQVEPSAAAATASQ